MVLHVCNTSCTPSARTHLLVGQPALTSLCTLLSLVTKESRVLFPDLRSGVAGDLAAHMERRGRAQQALHGDLAGRSEKARAGQGRSWKALHGELAAPSGALLVFPGWARSAVHVRDARCAGWAATAPPLSFRAVPRG